MKIVFSILTLLVITEACNSSKASTVKLSESDATERYQQNNTVVTYQALSRGTFRYISISKDSITLSSDRNLKNITPYKCSEQDWNTILQLLQKIDIISLPTLKPPTDKRLFDGAPHATLKITNANGEISTPSFDHGHPPKDIETLVNKVLSIGENINRN